MKKLRIAVLSICIIFAVLGFAIKHVAAVSLDQIEKYHIEYQGDVGA